MYVVRSMGLEHGDSINGHPINQPLMAGASSLRGQNLLMDKEHYLGFVIC